MYLIRSPFVGVKQIASDEVRGVKSLHSNYVKNGGQKLKFFNTEKLEKEK